MAHIRDATAADAARIAAIYNEAIAERSATFETDERTAADVRRWLDDDIPVLVAEDRDVVVGWARTAPYSEREAYAGVAEVSVYVTREARRRGAATALLAGLAAAAERRGCWKLVGKLFPENEATRALMRRCGWREVGVHRRHARLDDEWRDVVVVELLLGDAR
jgi:L-amino acid N-acyltransferase YncA